MSPPNSITGTLANPWTLAKATAVATPLYGDDVVLLRGGTYSGAQILARHGEGNRPLQYRSYPGEMAVIDVADGSLAAPIINGADLLLRDLVITNSDCERIDASTGEGVEAFSARLKMIHCVIHDTQPNGIGLWTQADGAELYGCIIYNQGYQGVDRGHGHAIYTQNTTATKRIRHCIFGPGFGWGLHAYSESGSIDHYHVEALVAWGVGMLDTVAGPGHPSILIGGVGANDWTIERPWIDGTVQLAFADQPSDGLTMTGGRVTGDISAYANWTDATVTTPENTRGDLVVVEAVDEHEAGRAHIVVFNAAEAATVTADPSAVLAEGDSWWLYDGLNPLAGPVASGTFNGDPITVPLTGLTMPTPVGATAPAHPTDFGVFVLRKVPTWVAAA